MSHGKVMEKMADKGMQPNKTWGKILKADMKLDEKEMKTKAKSKALKKKMC